jgi:hypothetical protein
VIVQARRQAAALQREFSNCPWLASAHEDTVLAGAFSEPADSTNELAATSKGRFFVARGMERANEPGNSLNCDRSTPIRTSPHAADFISNGSRVAEQVSDARAGGA